MIAIIRNLTSVTTAALVLFSFFAIVVNHEPQTAAASTPESYFLNPPGSDWGTLYSDDATQNATAYSAAEVTGGYVVAGTQTGPVGPGLDWWGVLAKINTSGTVIDNASFELDDDHNFAYDIIGVADGYVVTGTKHAGTEPNYDPYVWLMKTNTDLDRQWEHTYGNPAPDRGNSVFADGSGFIIGGFQGDGGDETGWLIQTDADGNQNWDLKSVFADDTTWWMGEKVYSVVKASDGGYVMGTANGIRKSNAPSSPPTEAWTAATGDPYNSVQQTADGGYIGVGTRDDDDIADGTTDVILTKLNASGAVQWSNTYSSDALVPDIDLESDELPYDSGRHVVQTSDGGYAIVGRTETIVHDGTTFYGNGGYDLWILKTNASGVLQWDLALGGDGDDSGQHIIETSDNDLLVSGSATVDGVRKMWVIKVNGDFTPPTPSFTYTPESPVFVGQQVRFNASASSDADGTITDYVWDFGDGNSGSGVTTNHTYRTPGTYTATLATTDNDGTTRSTSDTVTVVELGMAWERVIDGAEPNVGHAIVEAHDGGYVIAGYMENSAYGGSSTDGWLLKVNDDSTIAWERRFADWDNAPENMQTLESIAQTADGGYIVTGTTRLGTHTDVWLIKTDVNGDPSSYWYKTFGGDNNDGGHAVAQTADGGYIISGFKANKLYLLKTLANGNMDWDEEFTDVDVDMFTGTAVYPASDGGYIIAVDRDSGDEDILLIKTGSDGTEAWRTDWTGSGDWAGGPWVTETSGNDYVVAGSFSDSISLTKVNVSGVEQWSHTYDDGTNDAYGQFAAGTPDGGYLIVGYTVTAPDDVYLVKTDSSGNKEWDRIFGTAETDVGAGIIALSDGGYVVMYNRSTTGDTDLLIRKYGNTGVFATDGSVTIDEWAVTEDPGLDPGTYDTGSAPAGVDLDNSRGFEVTASGADGTYSFRINFTTPIDDDFTLYKLPGWTEVPYTVIDEYTIEIELDIVGGVLDPPFMFVPNTIPNTPTNTAPADEATGVGITPTLTSSVFSDVDTADTHAASQWQISITSGEYTSPVYNSATDTSNKTSIVVPSSTLETNTTYYFRVRHQDDKSDWSAWSVETLFTTLNTAPNQPTNTAPADEATGVSITPTLTSSAFSDVDTGDTHAASKWQISTTSGSYISTIYDTGADTSNKTSITIPAEALSYETTYYFRVQYKDNHGDWSDWSAETSFTTISEPNTAPNQPANTVPANAATGVSVTPTLTSSAFSDSDTGDTHAASQWQISATSGSYTSAIYDSGTDTSNKTSVVVPSSDLSYSTTYYFRVRHQDNNDTWSAWSTQTSFTTVSAPVINTAPVQPANTAPADEATGTSITPTLTSSAFSDVDTGDTHAASQWQITTASGDYTSPVYDTGTDTSNKASITIAATTLGKNTVYYWRIRHKDNYGDWSSWSTETSFTTAGGGGGCGASSVAASAADIAWSFGLLGFLSVSGLCVGQRQKKRKSR